jgi:hypothetical protein
MHLITEDLKYELIGILECAYMALESEGKYPFGCEGINTLISIYLEKLHKLPLGELTDGNECIK